MHACRPVSTRLRSHTPSSLQPCAPACNPFSQADAKQLHCLCIAKERGLHSLRDLRGTHLPMLRHTLAPQHAESRWWRRLAGATARHATPSLACLLGL